MTVAYMPSVRGLIQPFFELRRNIQSQQYLGGTALAIERGPALWATEYRLALGLTRAEIDPFLAWLDGIGTSRFLAYDLLRCRPHAHLTSYPGGFSGTATIASVTTTTVAMSGVVTGLTLKAGDLISLVSSDKYSLHRVKTTVVSTGTSMTVSVVPNVRTVVHATGSVVMTNPACTMVIDGAANVAREINRENPSFRAVQVFG